MKILCVIPALHEDLSKVTLKSIEKQTIPVTRILVLSQKVEGRTLPERVSRVLNEGLMGVNLRDFDFLLRVDGDVFLPFDFIEENLRACPDLCGGAGYAMLIRVEPFLRIMNGFFHCEDDDSYIRAKFSMCGCKVMPYQVQPVLLRRPGRHHGLKYYIEQGRRHYRLGWMPFWLVSSIRFDLLEIFEVLGYLAAFTRRGKRFDVAGYVQRHQIRRLLGWKN